MGLIIGPSFTTLNGIELQELYLSLGSAQIVVLGDGKIKCIFIFEAYTSRDAKRNGFSPIQLTVGQNIGETILTTSDFLKQNSYTLAYDSIKHKFISYNVSNIFESGQDTYLQYRFNADGYDIDGYTIHGYDSQGYDRHGYNAEGYNAQGYNAEGYNADGYNTQGYNAEGYDRQGYNQQGYNAEGYDIEGYDIHGFNADGVSMNGGYNQQGFLSDGTRAVFPSTILAYNTRFPEKEQSFAIRSDPASIEQLLYTLTNEINTYDQQQQAQQQQQEQAP